MVVDLVVGVPMYSGECTEQLLQLGLVQAVGGAFCILAKMILSGTILPGAELVINTALHTAPLGLSLLTDIS